MMSDYTDKDRVRPVIDPGDVSSVDRRLLELSALIEISQTLNSSLNLQSIFNNILLVPMGRMMLGKGLILLKKENSEFVVETLKGLPLSLQEKSIHIPDLPDHPVFLKDLPSETPWLSFFNDLKIELLIPFITRADILGMMGFCNKLNGQPFLAEEVDFLNSLANIAATSIENALVFEEIKKVNRQLDHKIQELNTLFDIGKELNLTLEKEKILKLLSYALMGQVTVNNFLIALKETDIFRAALVKGSTFALKEGELCKTLCERSILLTRPYLREDLNEFDTALNERGVRVIVPMQIQNETKGFIFLGDKITRQKYSASDLEFLQTLGNGAIISLENARLFQETLEKQRLEEEINLARKIQNRLFPKSMPELEIIKIHGTNVPSKQVGGDYYDVIRIHDQLYGLTIADVSGKGMPASLLMSNLQASLHSLIQENYALDKLVSRINNLIYNNTDPEKYITFFYGQLNIHTLDFQFVNAGHNPPFLVHRDGSLRELHEGGIILGMLPEMPYEIGNCTLQRGDTLLMYTDGVSEAMNSMDQEFGENRLKDFLINHCTALSVQAINENIIRELKKFTAGTQQSDDITLLTVQILV
jgi:sigma-B regulation protein RsbU (phosphoserine phosphatase)